MHRNADELTRRLEQLGLQGVAGVIVHRNRSVVVSLTRARVLRLHEGFTLAPDRVLKAIVRFVKPGTAAALRRAAHREIVTFPVEMYAPPPARRPVHPGDAPLVAELERRHQALNARHFAGALAPVSFRLSGRMRERLGEFRAARAGLPPEIAISRRHIERDGWAEVHHTLLHEMVHQWQAQRGKRVDHGKEFREKAREIGIAGGATRRVRGEEGRGKGEASLLPPRDGWPLPPSPFPLPLSGRR